MNKKSSSRLLSVIVSIALIFSMFPLLRASAASENVNPVIENPGFELSLADGKIPGWNIVANTEGLMEVSSDRVKSGTQSLHFKDSNNAKSLQVMSNKIDVVAEGSYIAKAFVNVVNQSHNIGYEVHYFNDSNVKVGSATLKLFPSSVLGKDQWTEIALPFDVPAGATNIKLLFNSGGVSLTEAYFDDVSIEVVSLPEPPEEPPAPVISDKIVNPGFEMDLVDGHIPGWSKDVTTVGSMELESVIVKNGSNSLHFHDSSATTRFRVLSDKIAVTPGITYSSSATVYVIQQTHNIVFEVQYFGQDDKEIGPRQQVLNAPATLQKEAWNTIENNSKAPAHAVYARIGFYSGDPSLTRVYFDDVTFAKEEDEPPIQDIESEIMNPGFEMILTDGRIPHWTIDSATEGLLEINTQTVRSGTNSLYFNDRSDTKGLRIFSNKVAVVPGESYIASAYANVVNQSHNIVLETYYYDAGGTQVGFKNNLFSSNSLGKNTWTMMRLSSDAPANAAYATIALYSGNPSLTEAYFDDVAFNMIPPVEPLDRNYQAPVNLGPMVSVNLGQAGAIQQNSLGENEVYFHTNGLPGKFYAVDAETGELKFSELIPNSEAIWAMTVGSDKNVYFSVTGDGKLYRYLPAQKKIELLGTNPSGSWVWDLEASPDGKIYGGTYNSDKSDGKVFEYDIATGTFRNYGSVKTGQDYVRGIAVDGDYIYAGLGTNVHLFKINRHTGEKTEIIIPDNATNTKTGDTGTIADVFIANGKLFVSVSTINMVVLDLQTHELLNTFQYSNMISKPSPYDPNLIYYKHETKLFKYNMAINQSSEIQLPVPLPDTVRVKDMQWIEMKSGEKAGKIVLAMVTQYGEYILYDPADHWLSFIELEIDPAPVRIQALELGMDGRIYLGGYQRGMSIYNPFTNDIDLNISSFAQPEGIGFMNDMVYYGTYVGAIMYRYDPTKPMVLNSNPELVYDIKNEQDRPFAITSGDNKLFVGTVPDYGMLGGSLAIYDEVKNSWTQYNQVVENQSILSLAYKDGFLYGGTTVWGGLGSNPAASEAKIFVWDTALNRKVDEYSIHIPGIDEAPRMIGEISFGPDGLLWGVVDGTIFALDTNTKQVVKSKLLFPSLYNTSKWKAYDLRWSPDGMIYTTLSRKLMVIDPETLRYKIIDDAGLMNDMTLGIDGSIYYVPDAGTTLSRIAVPETDATLSAITVDGKWIAGFSPGVTKYNVSALTNSEIQAATTQPGASVSTQYIESKKQTVITVTATDGKSKLEYIVNHIAAAPTPTIESISGQLEQFIASGDVTKPLTNQLQSSLELAMHHLNKGQSKQMIKSLEDFLKHLANKAHQDRISVQAKAKLEADVRALIHMYP